MWFFRKMYKIPWTAKRTNESVSIEVSRKATFMNKIRTQEARFSGHDKFKTNLNHETMMKHMIDREV